MISGKNIVLQIYNSSDEPFHNLVLRKPTYDSTVMSLADKISGFVYYKDNSLACTMHEYIVYDGVKYTLVNPPTIVREGLVADNSELKGMTKYSMEFYHPMVMLSDFPFTDVAVSNDELRYKSQDKSFTWVGYVEDYITKLNKNLQGTQWVCELSANTDNDTLAKFSDVLTFSNNTIADALKTAYDTWGIPYIIDLLPVSDERYSSGKRYLIFFGEPSNEIYASAEDATNETPFVFQFGQGVGLKNNSITPKNNKIVTRIAAYGSERNIPYGYPQILWTGNSSWDYTINNASGMQEITVNGQTITAMSYPIYQGIVGGQYVKLIKHPFTRKHLMPSVYAQTVAKKVDPNNANYDPNTTIVDYHDALDGSTYAHTINLNAPSYEIHEFEDIFPELGEQYVSSVATINDDLTPASGWDDSMLESGDYAQGYFKLTLPSLGFDLYACANITEQMQINMRSGACIGCTFEVQVDWEEYKMNFYDLNGDFAPNGSQRNTDKYPNSTSQSITLVCKKDIDTFGTIMPNIYQHPKGSTNQELGDKFVILGISLPTSYIANAQEKLDTAMDKYMLENNVHYFDYPLKFDEYFLETHQYILNQIKPNTIVRFGYNGDTIPLYVKQLTVKYGEKPLPEYSITLTDDIEVSLNQIGQANEAIGKMEIKVNALKAAMGKNVEVDLSSKLSRVSDDVATGLITFAQGMNAGTFVEDLSGFGVFQDASNNWVVEADYFHVRKKLEAESVEILHSSHIGGKLVSTAASMLIDKVVYDDDYTTTDEEGNEWSGACYKCYYKDEDSEHNIIYCTFQKGDLAFCETYNLESNSVGTTHADQGGNHYYWRKVIDVDETNCCIMLSDETGEYDLGSDYPLVGDKLTLLGSLARITTTSNGTTTTSVDTSRQNAIVIAGAGAGNPYIRVYKGINSFTLPTPNVQISPYGSWITVQDNNGQDARIDQLINSLYDQVEQVREQDDKQIVLWFGTATPTASNEPAVNWITDQIRHEHVKDIYYDRSAGKAYSYEETITNNVASYAWTMLTDTDVLRSLELAAAAQDTADGKRRVFVSRPTQAQPYDIGDLWVNATFPVEGVDDSSTYGNSSGNTHTFANPLYNNDILRCVTAKAEGDAFVISHWQPVQEFTTSKITQTTDQIILEVTQGLQSTGIDITNGLIELNATKTVVSDTLAVKRVETTPDTSTNQDNQAKVTIAGSEMNVFGSNGVVNIKFGVDENGYAVLKYYDRDGTFLYDLGPHGLNFLEVNGESFDKIYYVKMPNNLPDYSTDDTNKAYLYFFRPKRIGGMVFGDSTYTNGNNALAEEASGRAFVFSGGTETSIVTTSGGTEVIDTSLYASGLYRIAGSTIESIHSLDSYATIADAKEALVMQTGISTDDLSNYDWTLSNRPNTNHLKYAIHWSEGYEWFALGVCSPQMYVWQDSTETPIKSEE